MVTRDFTFLLTEIMGIFMRIIPFLAFKDLARDRKIATLVVFLLAFSYINLTFFPAFLNGLSNVFQEGVIDTTTSHIIIQPSVGSSQLYINSESSIRKKIDLIPGVVGSSSHINLAGTAYANGRQMSARVEAFAPSEDKGVTITQDTVVDGEFLSDTDRDSVVLGRYIAGEKIEDTISKQSGFGQIFEGLGGVNVGERVTIKFTNGVTKEYKIKGIVDKPGFGFTSQTVYIDRIEAEEVLGIEDQASSILVRLNDKDQAEQYKKLILELGIPSVKIQTWEEASSFAEGINQTFSIVILVTTIVGIIIVMATVGIVIFINTSRKKRIIGVLKAIGMQKKDIRRVFLAESIIFGVVGTLIGMAIVYGVIFYLTANPINVMLGNLVPILKTGEIINAVIIVVGSSVVAGYIPARMASQQEILENIKMVE